MMLIKLIKHQFGVCGIPCGGIPHGGIPRGGIPCHAVELHGCVGYGIPRFCVGLLGYCPDLESTSKITANFIFKIL